MGFTGTIVIGHRGVIQANRRVSGAWLSGVSSLSSEIPFSAVSLESSETELLNDKAYRVGSVRKPNHRCQFKKK